MRVFTGPESLEAARGSHLGYSEWHTVTQDLVNGFADITGDRQWIHVDVDRAAHGPFGHTIAHGYLALALIPRLLWQIYRLDGFSMEINYGLNRVRFPSPLPASARMRAGAELVDVVRSGQGCTATIRVQLDVENQSKPACVAEILVLLRT